MKRTIVLSCALVLLGGGRAFAAPEEEKYKGVADKLTKTLGEMADLLAGIKDEKSAKDAKPGAKKIGDELRKIKRDADDLGPPDAKTQAALDKEYRDKMKAVVTRVIQESYRVSKVPGADEVLKEFKRKDADKPAGDKPAGDKPAGDKPPDKKEVDKPNP